MTSVYKIYVVSQILISTLLSCFKIEFPIIIYVLLYQSTVLCFYAELSCKVAGDVYSCFNNRCLKNCAIRIAWQMPGKHGRL